MARETDLIDSAVDVAEVIHEYARKKGWERKDYNIQMYINPNYYFLSIYLFANYPTTKAEEQSIYDDLATSIQKKYKKNGHMPDGFNSFGIVIEEKKDNMEGMMPYFEDAVYVPSELLNPPSATVVR